MSDVGRPTDYDPKFCEVVIPACERGATDTELADLLGVHVATLYRWKAKYPDFCEAIRVGKEIADDRVERSLYARAVGYQQDAVKIFMPAAAPAPVYAPYVENVAPDPAAAMFWLKNRRPDKWRDKSTQEVTGANGAPLVPIINLTGRPEPSSAS